MRRWTLDIMVTLSLLILILTLTLWVRGYFRCDSVVWARRAQERQRAGYLYIVIASEAGQLGTRLEYHRQILRHSQKWPTAQFKGSRFAWGSMPHRPGRNLSDDMPQFFGFSARLWWQSQAFPQAHPSYTSTLSELDLIAPDWFIVLLFAILPAWRFGGRNRRRRRYRLEHGLCINCGYDLRAMPEAGGPLLERCPECGIAPSKLGRGG